MNVGDTVTKSSYGYFGRVVRFERKFSTDWAVVLWEGSMCTVREYPEMIEVCPVRPDRVIRYN